MWNEEIIRQRARKESKTLYISSACYSDKTNLMLQELRESLDMSQNKAITEESFWQLADSPFEWINGFIREQREGELYSKNDCLATMEALNYYDKIKKQQEETKMEAKKCERCGKLYEMQDAENYITAYMPGLPITDWNKENYSESRIRKDNTRIISVNLRGGQIVDLCPECREKLKNFFESGKDSDIVIKPAEE